MNQRSVFFQGRPFILVGALALAVMGCSSAPGSLEKSERTDQTASALTTTYANSFYNPFLEEAGAAFSFTAAVNVSGWLAFLSNGSSDVAEAAVSQTAVDGPNGASVSINVSGIPVGTYWFIFVDSGFNFVASSPSLVIDRTPKVTVPARSLNPPTLQFSLAHMPSDYKFVELVEQAPSGAKTLAKASRAVNQYGGSQTGSPITYTDDHSNNPASLCAIGCTTTHCFQITCASVPGALQ